MSELFAFVVSDRYFFFVILRPSGLLTCSLEGGCFWENTFETDYVPHHLNFPEGKFNNVRLISDVCRKLVNTATRVKTELNLDSSDEKKDVSSDRS